MSAIFGGNSRVLDVVLACSYASSGNGELSIVMEGGMPRGLLPLANKSILGYQLEWLRTYGVRNVFLVAATEYKDHLEAFLNKFVETNPSISIGPFLDTSQKVYEMNIALEFMDIDNPGDILRSLKEKILGDFVIYDPDTLTNYPLSALTRTHRIMSSDITVLLANTTSEKGDAKKSSSSSSKIEYIGIGEKGQILAKSSIGSTDSLDIFKTVLQKCISLNIRTDLVDTSIYCCSQKIMEVLVANPSIKDLQDELLPFFIGHYQTEEPKCFAVILDETCDDISGTTSSSSAAAAASTSAYSPVVGSTAPPSNASVFRRIREPYPTSYLLANKEFSSLPGVQDAPFVENDKVWSLGPGYYTNNNPSKDKFEPKFINTVVMENVTIGEKCKIQNCVIGAGTVIEAECTIANCRIAPNSHIKAKTKETNKDISSLIYKA